MRNEGKKFNNENEFSVLFQTRRPDHKLWKSRVSKRVFGIRGLPYLKEGIRRDFTEKQTGGEIGD